MGQLMALIQRTKIGQEVALTVWRKGQVITLKAVISEGAATATREAPAASKSRARDPDEVLQAVGIEVRDLVVQERLRGFRGVVATRVVASGLAAGKIQPGDLIGAVNQAAVGSANEFFIYLAASIADQPTTLTVLREGRVERIELPALPPKEAAPEGR
jgi:S1-C subfamily serine protease